MQFFEPETHLWMEL